ncbi:MAG: 2-dehydro-3-deoxygalactonokinase, partial [Pseudomonadota bacterium]
AGEARKARLAARLSGLTIGLELAGLGVELDGPVTLIGNTALCDRYALALEVLGHHSRRLDGEAAVLAGLALAHRALAV